MILLQLALAGPPKGGSASCTVTCTGEIVAAVDTKTLQKAVIVNGRISSDQGQVHVTESTITEQGRRYRLINFVYE